jgi:stage III sporulation protein AH
MRLKWKWRKPRINVIIGKKQIIIAGLTMLLGVAVFANYAVNTNRDVRPNNEGGANNNSGSSSNAGENSGSGTDCENSENNAGANYGDARFVSNMNSSVTDDDISAFFASARISKRESRDEAKEFLQAMISGGDVRGDTIQAIAMEASNLGEFIESEARVEARLRAQGFADVLCYISDRGTNIIVRTNGLTAQCAAIIRDAIISEVDVPVDRITIVEVN